MKILITGATGLVGKKLGLELTRLGHEIIIVSRDANKAKAICPFPCSIIEGDLVQSTIHSELLNSVDAVINLMGEPIARGRWTSEKKQKLYESRVTATRNLRSSFNFKFPKIVISTSAIGIYGDCKDQELDEQTMSGTGFLSQLCKDWEAEANLFSKVHSNTTANTASNVQSIISAKSLNNSSSDSDSNLNSIRIVIFRLGVVLSNRGGALQEMLPFFRTGIGGELSSGKQWMSWIHLDDLVQAFLHAIKNEKMEGVFNAVAPQPITNTEFTQKLAKVIHRPAILPVPKLALNTILGEKSEILIASQKVIPKRLLELGFNYLFPELSGALENELQHLSQNQDLLIAEQYIPLKLERVFPFFADANNLEKITPKFLNFKIRNINSSQMGLNTLIEYTLEVHKIPIEWKTKIQKWNPPHEFVDRQLKGPYKLWLHTHKFENLANGTLMTDIILYQLPFGYLGWLGGHKLVNLDLQKIFDFRRKQIDSLFRDTQ